MLYPEDQYWHHDVDFGLIKLDYHKKPGHYVWSTGVCRARYFLAYLLRLLLVCASTHMFLLRAATASPSYKITRAKTHLVLKINQIPLFVNIFVIFLSIMIAHIDNYSFTTCVVKIQETRMLSGTRATGLLQLSKKNNPQSNRKKI